MSNSGKYLLHFRLRHAISQERMAALIGVPVRRLAAWEKGEGPSPAFVLKQLLDLTRDLPRELLLGLSNSVVHCELPRALSRTSALSLRALSGPAIDKRPSIVEWIGQDLAPIACGVLRSLLDDGIVQRAIAKQEVVSVVTTTKGVLRTAEAEIVGSYRTTINYFFHDGVLFSDAVAVPAPAGEPEGYTPIFVDEVGTDLFGDYDSLEVALNASRARSVRAARG